MLGGIQRQRLWRPQVPGAVYRRRARGRRLDHLPRRHHQPQGIERGAPDPAFAGGERAGRVCSGLFYHPNEIEDLKSRPFDHRVSTVYTSGEGYGASVWKIPELNGQANSLQLQQLFEISGHIGKIGIFNLLPSLLMPFLRLPVLHGHIRICYTKQ